MVLQGDSSVGRASVSKTEGRGFEQFVRETVLEMKRVSWPSVAELKESTIVVLVTVFVITVMLFAVDNILDLGMQQIISLG